MKISVVTPFLNGLDLLTDYDAATQGAEVVIVDNGSDEATREALQTLPKERGRVIRNETNLGFAAANNQGYAAATGDIIVFLNSDIAADPAWLKFVADDVKDGALYGPSLAQQLVAGRWLPYVEGWCIAATRATWDKLLSMHEVDPDPGYKAKFVEYGPWDEVHFSGPYWEDNDLCLRALQAGIAIIQTTWPVQHKGGRSSASLASNAGNLETNRLTFSQRAMAAFAEQGAVTPTYARYMQQVHTQSDIQHHLPLLYALARGNVVELGTRSGVSTAALLAGVEAHGGHVYSIDIDPACATVAEGHPQWTFLHGSSTDIGVQGFIENDAAILYGSGEIDLLFIDTEHRYEQTQAELALWHERMKPGGHICLHDPETFPGVRRAVTEFCEAKGWPVTFVLPCHGMAVIDVPQYPEPVGVSVESASWAMEDVAR